MSVDPTSTTIAASELRSRVGYQPVPEFFDEMAATDGTVLPHWQTLLAQLDSMSLAEVQERWDDAQKILHENDLTYTLHSDGKGDHRPWPLDPIPFVLSSDEFSTMETGLVQRAKLLGLILKDLYGPQKLLSEGILPPELVFGHPAFLRCCHGINVPQHLRLTWYAADLGRTPDGNLAVISDRTEAPTGLGFALENRIILSRILPEIFRECRVQRLALFFHTFRETMRSLAPQNKDNPRVVLLSPGPQSQNYFGHAYLTRYLGYALVEGADLTVRDNRVYLKFLGGLQPVDVIVRRVPSAYCDPLELRGDSLLGIPGLVQSVRTGNVAIANSLGSGLVESPGLLPYLPAMCRHLLGEDLKIPSVPAYWCGDPKHLDHVLANLDRMVIKRTYGSPEQEPTFPAHLDATKKQALVEKIRFHPNEFVGQEHLALSTAPVLEGNCIQPRHTVLRSFLTASADGYTVMPGGLTKTIGLDRHKESVDSIYGSKDTWVLAKGPVSSFSLLRSGMHPVVLSRGGSDLPSRAADNLFWLGRYTARAESSSRLLRAILVRLTESSGVTDSLELAALIAALFPKGSFPVEITVQQNDPSFSWPVNDLLGMIYESRRSGSLAKTLQSLNKTANLTRDRISADMWRILSRIDLTTDNIDVESGQQGKIIFADQASEEDINLADVLDMLNGTVIRLAAFGGLITESMTRGQGWRFLDIGRRLERTINLADLIGSTLTTPSESEGSLLEALLEIIDSTMTYHRRYPGGAEIAPVLDLLLADEDNPRSVSFQLAGLMDQVEHLPRPEGNARRSPEERIVLELLTEIRLLDIETIAAIGDDNSRVTLASYVSHLQDELENLSDTISRSFLSHLRPARQFASQYFSG